MSDFYTTEGGSPFLFDDRDITDTRPPSLHQNSEAKEVELTKIDKPEEKAENVEEATIEEKTEEVAEASEEQVEATPENFQQVTEVEAAEEETVEEETQEENVEQPEEEAEEAEESAEKTFKVSVDDGEIEIPESTKIKLETKSGKEAEVSFEELKNDYWGKQEISRQFSELDNQKKEFQTQLEAAKGFNEFNDNISKLEGDDLLLAVLNKANELNPQLEKAFEDYYNRIFETAQVVKDLSPEQKELYEAQQKVKSFESKEQQRETEALQKQHEDFKSKRSADIRKKWSVDNDLIDGAYTYALNNRLIDREKTSLEETFRVVEDIVAEYTYEGRALGALQSIKSDKAEDLKAVNDLIDWQFRNPKAGDKELKARAKKLYGPVKSKAEPKATKAKPAKRTSLPPKKDSVVRGGSSSLPGGMFDVDFSDG
jgi:hypothetical protein